MAGHSIVPDCPPSATERGSRAQAGKDRQPQGGLAPRDAWVSHAEERRAVPRSHGAEETSALRRLRTNGAAPMEEAQGAPLSPVFTSVRRDVRLGDMLPHGQKTLQA